MTLSAALAVQQVFANLAKEILHRANGGLGVAIVYCAFSFKLK
jgi:hypothetical protein